MAYIKSTITSKTLKTHNFGGTLEGNDFSSELEQFSIQYPSIKKELIDKRDLYMSTNIVKLFRTQNCNRMLAIVGEGHVMGMAEKLSRLNPKVVRLRDLLQNTDNSISFSIEV